MALERGTLGRTKNFFPLTTGFAYELHDEMKHGLSPEVREAMEQGIAREQSLLSPPSLAICRYPYESNEDYLARRLAADSGESL